MGICNGYRLTFNTDFTCIALNCTCRKVRCCDACSNKESSVLGILAIVCNIAVFATFNDNIINASANIDRLKSPVVIGCC